jgi:murein DD-endopeptidase MepM/ murein hydrolase activator NlpD
MAFLENWPLVSYEGRPPVVSSGYGMRGKGDKRHMHSGLDIDYRAISGDPPYTGKYTKDRTPNFYGPPGQAILAVGGGMVKVSKTTPKSKGVIEIEHPPAPGTQKKYRSIYRHLLSRFVKPGTYVDGGTRIGIMGASAGTPFRHLHFAMKYNGKFVDPEPMLKRAGVMVLTHAESTPPPKKKKKPSTPTVTAPKPKPSPTAKPGLFAGAPDKRILIAWLTLIIAVLALEKSR